MGVKVNITHNMPKKIDSTMRKFESSINQWVDKTGTYFRNEIALTMKNSPATGRKYQRGKKVHIASSKGNPPRVDTSILWNSIQYKRTGVGEGLVSTNIEYSEKLEMEMDRPFMSKRSKAYKNAMIRGKMLAQRIGIK